ncbi:MAG TPA: HD domain-containing protein [Gemmataceae bacterium]|jgi:(p)ppGpp synthase/HD superfamily hydrolase
MTAASDQPGLNTERFGNALVYAAQLHARQVRKGTTIPYVAHLLAVAAILLEDGGSEDEAMAASQSSQYKRPFLSHLEDGGSEDEAMAALLHDLSRTKAAMPHDRRSAAVSATKSSRSSTAAPTPR